MRLLGDLFLTIFFALPDALTAFTNAFACPCGIRHKGGMTLIQAFARNVGTFPVMVRENTIS